VTWPEYKAFMDEYERVFQRRVKERNLEDQIPSDKFADAVTYPTRIAWADFDDDLKARAAWARVSRNRDVAVCSPAIHEMAEQEDRPLLSIAHGSRVGIRLPGRKHVRLWLWR